MNFKIRVNNPEHSKQIQELCFNNGIYWRNGVDGVTVRNTEQPVLFIDENKLTYFYNDDTFNQNPNKEITLEELQVYFKGEQKEEHGKAVFHEDRLMRVSNIGNTKKITRVVFGKKNGKYLAWTNAETLEDAKNCSEVIPWPNAEEIPKQISRKEIADKFGITGEFEIID